MWNGSISITIILCHDSVLSFYIIIFKSVSLSLSSTFIPYQYAFHNQLELIVYILLRSDPDRIPVIGQIDEVMLEIVIEIVIAIEIVTEIVTEILEEEIIARDLDRDQGAIAGKFSPVSSFRGSYHPSMNLYQYPVIIYHQRSVDFAR